MLPEGLPQQKRKAHQHLESQQEQRNSKLSSRVIFSDYLLAHYSQYYKIIQKALSMLRQPTSQNDANQQVYGFLCKKTNVFYAFETYEAYSQFLDWLQNENFNAVDGNIQSEEIIVIDPQSESEMKDDDELATEEIMKVFEDPRFKENDRKVSLEEIDF